MDAIAAFRGAASAVGSPTSRFSATAARTSFFIRSLPGRRRTLDVSRQRGTQHIVELRQSAGNGAAPFELCRRRRPVKQHDAPRAILSTELIEDETVITGATRSHQSTARLIRPAVTRLRSVGIDDVEHWSAPQRAHRIADTKWQPTHGGDALKPVALHVRLQRRRQPVGGCLTSSNSRRAERHRRRTNEDQSKTSSQHACTFQRGRLHNPCLDKSSSLAACPEESANHTCEDTCRALDFFSPARIVSHPNRNVCAL